MRGSEGAGVSRGHDIAHCFCSDGQLRPPITVSIGPWATAGPCGARVGMPGIVRERRGSCNNSWSSSSSSRVLCDTYFTPLDKGGTPTPPTPTLSSLCSLSVMAGRNCGRQQVDSPAKRNESEAPGGGSSSERHLFSAPVGVFGSLLLHNRHRGKGPPANERASSHSICQSYLFIFKSNTSLTFFNVSKRENSGRNYLRGSLLGFFFSQPLCIIIHYYSPL